MICVDDLVLGVVDDFFVFEGVVFLDYFGLVDQYDLVLCDEVLDGQVIGFGYVFVWSGFLFVVGRFVD